MTADLPIDFFVVESGMVIAFPGVDGVALSLGFETLHRLAKCEKGGPSVGAKLHQRTRTQRSDQPECKRHVFQPCRLRPQLLRRPEAGRRDEAAQINVNLDRSLGVAPPFITRGHALSYPHLTPHCGADL